MKSDQKAEVDEFEHSSPDGKKPKAAEGGSWDPGNEKPQSSDRNH